MDPARSVLIFAVAVVVVIAALCRVAAAQETCPPERTMPVDPVELIAGREVPGDPAIALDHEGVRYTFVSGATREAFAANPHAFAAADGGACGRMGPLSGVGDARRHAVHEGRLYFFASDACRATFLKDPSRCIETAQTPPQATDAERDAAAVIVGRVLAWAGGRERLAAIRTYRQELIETVNSGGRDWRHGETVSLALPASYAASSAWDDRVWVKAFDEKAAWARGPDSAEPLAAERAAALRREAARVPAMVLHALAVGEGVLGAPAERAVDGLACDTVPVHFLGATVHLAVERGSGRLAALRFRGRDEHAFVAEIDHVFTAFTQTAGVTLPSAWRVDAGDRPATSSVALTLVAVDDPLPPETFHAP